MEHLCEPLRRSTTAASAGRLGLRHLQHLAQSSDFEHDLVTAIATVPGSLCYPLSENRFASLSAATRDLTSRAPVPQSPYPALKPNAPLAC
jgi:hypothetical protein